MFPLIIEQNNGSLLERRIMMTNKNDNRERMNKYPNNKTEFAKDVNIRSEITKKDMKK